MPIPLTEIPTDPFVILGEIDPFDEVQLYWSNDDGWVDRSNATVFTADDITHWPHGTTGTEKA